MSDFEIKAVTRIQKIYRGHYTRSRRDDIEDLCLFRKRIRSQIRNCQINCYEGTRVGFVVNNRSHLKRFEEWKHQAASKIQRAFKVFLVRRNELNKRVESNNKIQLTATIRLQCFARKIIAKRHVLSLRESRIILARSLGARLVQSAFRSLLARRRTAGRRYQVQSLAACVIQSSYRSHTAIKLVKVIKEKTSALKRFNGAIALQCLIRQRIACSRVNDLATCRLVYSLSIYTSTIQALVRGFLVRLTLYKIRFTKRMQKTVVGKLSEVKVITGFDGSAATVRKEGNTGEDKFSMVFRSPEPPVTPAAVDGLRTRIARRPTLVLAVSALTTAILSTAPFANVLNVLTLLLDLELDDCFNKVDDGSGVTVLQLASQLGLLDVVRLLLKSVVGKKREAEASCEGVITAMHKACRPVDPSSQALPMVFLLLGIEEAPGGGWSLNSTEYSPHSPSSCSIAIKAESSTDTSLRSDWSTEIVRKGSEDGSGSRANPPPGAVNIVGPSYMDKLKYSRSSSMKKHVLRMAQALSWCGPDGRNCILHAALSGQTLVLDFALQVMTEAKHIREVVGSRATEVMRVEALRDTLKSNEKNATILAAAETEEAAALIAEAELTADLDAAAASNMISASSDTGTQGPQVVLDTTGLDSTTPAHSSHQCSSLTLGTETDEGQHTGVGERQHPNSEEETRSEDSSDDELPETPPPPVVEVERVWSRRTSLRYQQLTSEKLQKDLQEKERLAAVETARINICLFPDVLDVTVPYIEWCEDDADCTTALAKSGNIRCLSHLLDSSFDPSTVSKGGVTLAMVAASEGQYDTLNLLMGRDLDLRIRDDSDRNVLHYAAACTEGNVVSYLLTHPRSKQCHLHERGLIMQDTDGCTPLHIACRADIGIFLGNLSADVISELVMQRNKEGLTSLLVACSVNGATAVRNCLKLGSDATAVDSSGHSAIWQLCHQPSVVDQDSRSDLIARSPASLSAAHSTTHSTSQARPLPRVEYDHMTDIVETAVCLLKAGCPLFSAPFVPADAWVLHTAHTTLIDSGSEWYNMASRKGSVAFFKGIATHLSSHDGWTAVLSSISCHTDEGVLIFRALMAGGAAGRMLLEPQIDPITPEGGDILRTLDPHKELTPVIKTAPSESHRTVKERRPSLIDLTGCTFGGFTVGGWAVRLGGVQVVEHLLSCGYNPTQSADSYGNSMIHLAAKYGTEAMVDAVCSPRRFVIHLEAPNNCGYTAAMEGAKSGNVKGVKRLISYGASARRALDGRYCAWLLSLVAAQDKEKKSSRNQTLPHSQPLDSTDDAPIESPSEIIQIARNRFLVHNAFDLDILRKRTRHLLSSGNAALLTVE